MQTTLSLPQSNKLNRRPVKVAKISGRSITQPNLGQTVGQIIDKIQRGQTIPQSMPLFFGDKLPELIGFENMSKLEQIEYAREFREHAKKQYEDAEAEAKNLNLESQKAAAVAAAQP